MYYVYLIQSLLYPEKIYVGYTLNVEERLAQHNAGNSVYTAQYKPWKLIVWITFVNKSKAIAFEKYLKSGSGSAFAKKRLW
jgi:predicted GIY-YIG superfamily endonuclease